MKCLLLIAFTLVSAQTSLAEDVFRIEVGRDYKSYSNADLQRRVFELERAVRQLQQKVFALENKPIQQTDTWACTMTAMGNTYSATGPSKAVAQTRVLEACKAGQGDAFFCKDAKCSQ